MKAITDYVKFNDKDLQKKYGKKRIPMATLYEAYFDGDIDIDGDIYEFLAQRDMFTSYSLTAKHFQWAATNLIPEVLIHSQEQDKRIVREHYDRGNDFFNWFLGEPMVYTSGFYTKDGETLEECQANKLNLVCQKLQLKPGDTLLDIGCGWGTLAAHAAKYYGVKSTGITIAKEQTKFGNDRIKEWGVEDSAEILCMDYRDIPKLGRKFDKIVSLEMVEHVGVKNLNGYYSLIYDLLEDDGQSLIQWTGLRKGQQRGNPIGLDFGTEDLIWGLFMNKYIFPGADASLACSPMLKYMENANFEIATVENISIHYALTIKAWHDNWLENEDDIKAKYGERWFRMYHFFLAWSVLIAEQGSAACFQVIMNKNLDQFDRTRWIGQNILGERSLAEFLSPEKKKTTKKKKTSKRAS